jgi:hypothetical protein
MEEFIEKFPKAHFDKVSDEKVDWRKVKTEDEDDDVEKPATQGVIDMLGVDPDELFNETEKEDVGGVFDSYLKNRNQKKVKDALPTSTLTRIARMKEIVAGFPSLKKLDMSEGDPPDNSDVTYKDHTIKLDPTTGEYNIFAIGGALVQRTKTLEIAKKFVESLSIQVKR